MKKTLIFGHKNPDTDTISSAMAYAELKRQLGLDVEPVRLGELNGETSFALNYFQLDAPRLITSAADEVEQVILVDHNERQQSVSDIDQVSVLEVIDHHRIANFETSDPLYYRAEPVGCTATILNKLYKENQVSITKPIAGLMLSAIISDTLLFKSPTCTEEDVNAAKELAIIADVDPDKYGLEMLKAGTDFSNKTVQELISLDAKQFDMGEYLVEVAQVNTVDTKEILKSQEELEAAINEVVQERNLDLFVFVVTNILTNDSDILAIGNKLEAVETAFQTKLDNNVATLKGVVSRKKQIVPQLTKALS